MFLRFSFTIVLIILALTMSSTYSQEEAATGTSPLEIYQLIETSIFLLKDGQQQTYGLYVAGAKSKKFIYVLGLNNLTVGLETRMAFENLKGKRKDLEAEEFGRNEDLGIAIYKIKTSTKNLLPVIRHPDISKGANTDLWTLGSIQAVSSLIAVQADNVSADQKSFMVTADLPENYQGLPVFDANGQVLGIIAENNEDGTYHAIGITPLIALAVESFAGLDLFPIWREVYPTQFAIEKVRASTALLDTQKPGAGFFIGRDKNNAGYILTANHVVESDPGLFSVSFSDYLQEDILGQVMAETQSTDLDLAIVKVEECPAVKPVTFWTKKDLKQLEKVFAPQTVANVGYSAVYDEETNFFQFKYGSITKVTEITLETDLALQSGDSGGPLFNENAEIVGINLKTELSEETQDTLSVANNVRTLLDYLDEKTKNIDFTEKWQFLEKPSFWKKNRSWIIPVGTASVVGVGVFVASSSERDPISGIDATGDFPPIGQ